MGARTVWLVCALVFCAAPARAEESVSTATEVTSRPFAESAVKDMLGGGAKVGRWGITLQGGWAWSAARAQLGVANRLSVLFQFETALGVRFQPAAGVSVRLLDWAHARVSAELLAGWLIQTGEISKRGPTGELRFRTAFPAGRWVPYLVLGTRHALLPDRTSIERVAGGETQWSVRHEWTPWIGAGLAIAIKPWLGIDVGVDYGWIGAPATIVLPGFHLGVHFGGG